MKKIIVTVFLLIGFQGSVYADNQTYGSDSNGNTWSTDTIGKLILLLVAARHMVLTQIIIPGAHQHQLQMRFHLAVMDYNYEKILLSFLDQYIHPVCKCLASFTASTWSWRWFRYLS